MRIKNQNVEGEKETEKGGIKPERKTIHEGAVVAAGSPPRVWETGGRTKLESSIKAETEVSMVIHETKMRLKEHTITLGVGFRAV